MHTDCNTTGCALRVVSVRWRPGRGWQGSGKSGWRADWWARRCGRRCARGVGNGACAEIVWRTTVTAASFPEAVRENEEVVPVNAVSTWVLPFGVTVGR